MTVATIEDLQALFGGTVNGPWLKGATVAGQECDLYRTSTGGFGGQTKGSPYTWRELRKFVYMSVGMKPDWIVAANDNTPVDLWAHSAHPPLPGEVLPEVIGDFASLQGSVMGVDSGGLAMAALATCAAAIPDRIVVQPKEHDPSWTESARLWMAVIGNPSTKKSPLISAATKPLKRLDRELYQLFVEEQAEYDALDKDEKKTASKPRHHRLRLEDTTMEAAQEVLRDSPNGVLLIQDELSGWFGSMDKYSGGRGSAKDRAFWLQSFNGGSYTVNRVGRGASWIDNLSVSLVGGIQPEPMRRIANESHDDGLLQRLFPIVLRPARLGQDVPMPDVAKDYDRLIGRLHAMKKPMRGGLSEVSIRFDGDAQATWADVTRRNHDLQAAWETVNGKLAAHLGKYDGLFARLCLVWHCIETDGDRPGTTISGATAERVRTFLYDFLFPHAVAFYCDVLGLSDRQDAVLATAGWILTHRPSSISVRDVRRGDRKMRDLDGMQAEAVLAQLDAFRWITPMVSARRDSKVYEVDSRVYEIFDDRAEDEAERRQTARSLIAGSLTTPN